MSVAYKETIKREQWGHKELLRRYENGDIEEVYAEYDQRRQQDKVLHRTVKHPDGSAESYDQYNILTQQTLCDGTTLEFDNGKLCVKYFPDGSKERYHSNGKISSRTNSDGSLVTDYYENGKISMIFDYKNRHFAAYTADGNIKFTLMPNKSYINTWYYPVIKLGIKDRNHENHWREDFMINPNKKTILFFGGSGTYDGKAANGYLNSVIDIFGMSAKQITDTQLVSAYRSLKHEILKHYISLVNNGCDIKEYEQQTYKKAILAKLMPFMAQQYNGRWERIPPQRLYANFRNLMLISHCYGTKDIYNVADILRQTLNKLGYSTDIQKHALSQIICITNNTQHDFNTKTGFTAYHRYSVFDGQWKKQYNKQYSDNYPVFLEDYPAFHQYKKSKTAFINLNKKEMLLVFNKVLHYQCGKDEHNSAFWTVDRKLLTSAGKMQAELIKSIGQHWFDDNSEITSAADFMKQSTQNLKLRQQISAALINGRKLQKDKINPLHNHSILSSAYEKYKSMGFSPEKHGVWKLLSEQAKKDTPQERCAGLYMDVLLNLKARN
ncbi:MAG: hypothetical protein IJS88_05730 [Alphaproteobacteria bacterium]|nr:hypothetical protein [Alphaproteobacteria bacterium]